jgi:hypothetical protein
LKDYEQTYDEFWKDIVEDGNGNLNIDQIKRELHDFRLVMKNTSKIYDQLTFGRYSKPLTRPEYIISTVEEIYSQRDEER